MRAKKQFVIVGCKGNTEVLVTRFGMRVDEINKPSIQPFSQICCVCNRTLMFRSTQKAQAAPPLHHPFAPTLTP